MMLGRSVVRLGYYVAENIKTLSKFPVFTQLRQNHRISHHKNNIRFSFSSSSSKLNQTQSELYALQQRYRQQLNFAIFEQSIRSSTQFLRQMTIFKIFKVLEGCAYNHANYASFYQLVQSSIKKKSDNMLLLLASIKKRIAQNHKSCQQYQKAITQYQNALDLLQSSLVPPLFPYYSMYRQYGLVHDLIGDQAKARQILSEAVQILDDFVGNSDDNVSSNDFSKKQAAAYNVLARIDPQNITKWVDKANQAWKMFTDDKLGEMEYAKTVAQNLGKLLKDDREKGEAYYHYNFYQFKTKQMKDLLKLVFDQHKN